MRHVTKEQSALRERLIRRHLEKRDPEMKMVHYTELFACDEKKTIARVAQNMGLRIKRKGGVEEVGGE